MPTSIKRAAARAPKPDLTLSLQFPCADHRDVLSRARVRRWLQAALEGAAEITVRIVDADEGRALNLGYRQKDYATNVLTFDYARDPLVMADLVLCAPVVAQEAQREGKSLEAHYAHLLVHGALHAQGYDHEDEADAQAMEARERDILGRLGFDDPYGAVEEDPALGVVR